MPSSSGFYPAGHALHDLRLSEKSPLLKYPTQENWSQFRDALGFAPALEARWPQQAAVVIVGPHSTGKTFHALRYGCEWSAHRDRLASYGIASGINVSAVRELWNRHPSNHHLWIVDDAHDASDIAEALWEVFRNANLGERGNRLLFLSWNTLDVLEGLGDPVPVGLTEESVAEALLTSCHLALNHQVLTALVQIGGVGLWQILRGGLYQPKLLDAGRFEELQQQYVSDRLEGLREEDKQLLFVLARLRLLGVNYPATVAASQAFQRLSYRRLANEPVKGEWSIAEDDDAQALLRYSCPQRDLNACFIDPMHNLLRTASGVLAWRVMSGLLRRRPNDLERWLGVQPSSDRTVLLSRFAVEISTGCGADLEPLDLALSDAADVLSYAKTHLSLDVKARARSVLSRSGQATGRALTNPRTWVATRRLAKLTGGSEFDAELSAALSTDVFRDMLDRLPGPVRGQILIEISGFDARAAKKIRRGLLPVDGSALAQSLKDRSIGAILKRLTRAGAIDASLAVGALEHLPLEQVATLVYRDPSKWNWWLRSSWSRNSEPGSRARTVVRRALRSRSITDEDVAAWTSPDLTGLVWLAREANLPSALENKQISSRTEDLVQSGGGAPGTLVNIVTPWRRYPHRALLAQALARAIRDQGRGGRPLMWLAKLDPRVAKTQIEPLLKAPIRTEVPEWRMDAFWLLFIAIQLGASEPLRVQFVQILGSTWHPTHPADAVDLAIGGLLVYLGRSAHEMTVAPPPSIETLRDKVRDPAITACILLALTAMAGTGDATAALYLESLLGVVSDPEKEYRDNWYLMPPAGRQLVIRLVKRAELTGPNRLDNRLGVHPVPWTGEG